jgi:hypothetical protein
LVFQLPKKALVFSANAKQAITQLAPVSKVLKQLLQPANPSSDHQMSP